MSFTFEREHGGAFGARWSKGATESRSEPRQWHAIRVWLFIRRKWDRKTVSRWEAAGDEAISFSHHCEK